MAFFSNYFFKLTKLAKNHKYIFAAVFITVAILGYWSYGKLFSDEGGVRYITGRAEKGTLIVSISGSGQVSSSNQVDIKPKASGDVVYVGVKNGDSVGAGTLIAQIDSGEAEKSVRDAEVNLESAKLSLEKLKKPADALSMIQAENALTQATSNLEKAYDDGFNSVSNAFLDLPTVMTGLQDVLYGKNLNVYQDNVSFYGDMVKAYDEGVLQFKEDAVKKYQLARTAYDKTFLLYRSETRSSGKPATENLIEETYDTVKIVADAVKSVNDLLGFVEDRLIKQGQNVPAILNTHQSSLETYTGKTNSHLVTLLGIKNTIVSSKQSIAEKTEALAKLKAGADTLDIQSSELSVKQRENALLDAKEKLADYFIRAPFNGVIAKMNVKKGDPVSSSVVVSTLIARQILAEISLNEVDVAKVKLGQKVILTFDAIPDLTITGEVAEIDAVGTVSQGVVTYAINIVFDTQDERVKSAMSVSVSVITEAKPDILLVPNSAIKQENDISYVEIFVGENKTPRIQNVEIGISNDTMTEIVSGLNEGDVVVTRTTTDTNSTQTQQAPSLFGTPGSRGGGGGQR